MNSPFVPIMTSQSPKAPPTYKATAAANGRAFATEPAVAAAGAGLGGTPVKVDSMTNFEENLGATVAELTAAMPEGAPPVYDDTALFKEGTAFTSLSKIAIELNFSVWTTHLPYI